MRLHQKGKEFLASIFKTYCWGFRCSSGGKGVHPTLLHHIPHLSNCVLAVSLWLENVCIEGTFVITLFHYICINFLCVKSWCNTWWLYLHDGSTYINWTVVLIDLDAQVVADRGEVVWLGHVAQSVVLRMDMMMILWRWWRWWYCDDDDGDDIVVVVVVSGCGMR